MRPLRSARTLQLLTRARRRASLNLMAVVPPASLRAVTDPAAILAHDAADAADAAAAVPPVGDLPLSDVCARLYLHA